MKADFDAQATECGHVGLVSTSWEALLLTFGIAIMADRRDKLGFEGREDIVATGSEFDWIDMTLTKERFLEARRDASPFAAP